MTKLLKAIGLTNVTTQHIRAEEIKNRQFDFVVSRAVAPIKELVAMGISTNKERQQAGITKWLNLS
ncbi:MAG: RsmG family class I SAM-dependent methyltransferase [Segetibacter sp.]